MVGRGGWERTKIAEDQREEELNDDGYSAHVAWGNQKGKMEKMSRRWKKGGSWWSRPEHGIETKLQNGNRTTTS